MSLTFQEALLLLFVISAFIVGVMAVYRSAKHTAGEKLYWYFIIFIFNVLGVGAYFFDYFIWKKKRA